jgi:hypothetical protein
VDQASAVASPQVISTSYALDSINTDDGDDDSGSTDPVITSVYPASASPGTNVRVTGLRFGGKSTGTISFGGVNAAVVLWSTTSITAAVPALQPGAVSVVVDTPQGASNERTFTVESAQSAGDGPTDTGNSGTIDPGTGTSGTIDPGSGSISDIAQSILASGIGYQFDHRTRITPAGFALGEHVYSLSLAPGEEATIEQKTYTKRDLSIEESLDEDREINIELASSFTTELTEAVTHERELSSKLDIANKNEVGAKATIPIKGIPVEFNASSSLDLASSIAAAAKTTESDSSKRTYERTSKVASKMRAQHKTMFKVSTETGFERTGKRVIKNPNRGTGLDLHFFKVMAALKLRHERYGVRLCWAPYVKDPGAGVRRRAAEAATAARQQATSDATLPPKPEPPTDAERRRSEISSQAVDLAKYFGFWNDMRVDVDVPIEASGKDWDGTAPRVTLNFSGRRAAGANVVGNPWRDGTKLMVRVHVGIDWTLTEDRGLASVQVTLGIVDVSDVDAAKAMKEYRATLATWEKELAQAKADARTAAGLAERGASDPILDGYDAMTELLANVIVSHFPAASRDDFREVDYWSRVFDVERGGYALYPGIWAGVPLAYPDRDASDFLNASWARVFLPVRVGYERAALMFLLTGGRGAATAEQTARVKAAVDELEAFRAKHFGAADGMAIDGTTHAVQDTFDILAMWTETTPTDGTHVEAVLSATTALDDASEEALKDEAELRSVAIREQSIDADLREKATTLMSSATTSIDVTANGK